jgi:hypothetical protein
MRPYLRSGEKPDTASEELETGDPRELVLNILVIRQCKAQRS